MSYLEVKKIGKLELIDVLAEYDHPLLFVCRDEFASLFMIVETKEEGEQREWIAIKITENQYHDIVGERCSFESVFRNNASSFIYLFSRVRGNNVLECSIIDNLPSLDTFIGDTLISELGYEPACARPGEDLIIEMEAFPNQDIHSVPVEMNKAICDSIEKTVQSKYGKDYYLECDTPRAASYGFRFLIKSIGMLPLTTTSEVATTIAQTISSDEDTIMSESLDTVESISKLYKALKKHKTNVIVNTVQKNNRCLYSKEIPLEKINEIEESIASRVKDIKTKKDITINSTVDISGVLSAYDVRKKRFEIISEKKKYSGSFAESYQVENQVVGINSLYNARIVIKDSGKKELLELYPQHESSQTTF